FVPSDENANYNMDFFDKNDIETLKSIKGISDVKTEQEADLNNITIGKNSDTVEVDDSSEYKDDTIYESMYIKDKKEDKAIDLKASSDKEMLEGRNFTQDDNAKKAKIAVVDDEIAENIFGSSKNAIDKGIEIKGQVFTIVGVYEGTSTESMFSMPESNIIIPKDTYHNYFEENSGSTYLVLTIEKGYTPNTVTEKAIKELEKTGSMSSRGDYQVYDMSLLTDGISKMFSTITYFVSAVAGISLFIAGVGVMNMMYISVAERTKEIGIRRAMGATENAIRLQFLLEGITLTLTGGVIGYILGILAAKVVGMILDIKIVMDLSTILLAIGVSTLVGLIFSVVPASSATKKDLIDILR
ncbi:MAG: FtsX-like permease family protein, partial [Clostridioides sp.]|nr:FtsX-like permease family protein [Clostridioides sp.]